MGTKQGDIMFVLATKKILWLIFIGLFIADGYGSTLQAASRIRELFLETSEKPGRGDLSSLKLPASAWSLRNPTRKSLHEILSEQRQKVLTTTGAVDPVLSTAFEEVKDIVLILLC